MIHTPLRLGAISINQQRNANRDDSMLATLCCTALLCSLSLLLCVLLSHVFLTSSAFLTFEVFGGHKHSH